MQRETVVAIAELATTVLTKHFESTGNVTKYIYAFRTRRGRELALERERDGIYVWTEQAPDRPLVLPAPEAYGPKRPRNSNLKCNAKRLTVGSPAWYWRLGTAQELEQLCVWYSRV